MKNFKFLFVSIIALTALFTACTGSGTDVSQPEAVVVLTQADAGESSGFDFSNILNIVLTVTSIVFAGLLAKVKGKLSEAIQLGREILEVGTAIEEELKDNSLDEAGKHRILKEWADVKAAFKKLVTFKKKE